MKTQLTRRVRKMASALIATLVLCSILSVFVMYYLSLIEQQGLLSQRSQVWNMSMAVVEAGIEEGLQALNSDLAQGASLSGDGWTINGTIYQRTQQLSDGNSYTVTIDFTDKYNPTVYATASINAPTAIKSAMATPTIGFAQIGTAPVSVGSAITRAVRVRCWKGSFFNAAFVARNNIDLHGNGVYTDSFDSSDPTKSTNGLYDSSKYSGNKGDIATDGGIFSSVSLGNANIYGDVHTGPNCPVMIGPNGGIGPHGSQVNNLTVAAKDGYLLQDANFTFPDTTLPDTAGLVQPPSKTLVNVTNSYGTNYTTSTTYPSPVPPGGVITNVAYNTSTTWPGGGYDWITTNSTPTTSSGLPALLPQGTITTNIFTTNLTTKTCPSPGTYVGGITTNVVTKGNPSQRGTWYTFNLITSQTYTYGIPLYTYPCYSYTYSLVYVIPNYTTNYYPYVVEAKTTNVLLNYSGGTIFIDGPNAALVMPNGLSGSENFVLNNGASLVIYAGGTSVSISGNQVLNPGGFAGNFIVLCAPSVTSFTLNGNGTFTGVLVAPNANLTMNGSGNNNQDFVGCLMVNNVTMNGHFSFHYDECLSRGPSNGRYLIKQWDEIKPSQVPLASN